MGAFRGSGVGPVYEPARAGDVQRSFADVSAAAAQLGWTPQVALREGLERTVGTARARDAEREGRIAG